MNSEERRERRYQRRKAARKRQRDKRLKEYDDFDQVTDANNLILAFRKSKSGVDWKASVQRYEMNMLRNVNNTVKSLTAGEDVSQGFIVFWLCERGKLRMIKSVHIKERVVQRSLCDYALVPTLRNGLVYDNGASMEGKGIHFALNRLEAHLHQFYRDNGFSNDGYILVIDFSKYFDNILHEPVYDILAQNFSDDRILNLAGQLIRPFCAGREDGLQISLGIGSQISQILAIRFPSDIDHFIEQDLGVHYHARYNDDSYLIHQSKEYLWHCLEVLEEKFREKGIIINRKKTQVIKLSSWFTFLKWRYKLTDTGGVVKKPCPESITRERSKLKKLKKRFDAGTVTFEDVRCQFDSWEGYIKYGDSTRTVENMCNLFNRLFVLPENGGNYGTHKVQKRRSEVRGNADTGRKKQSVNPVRRSDPPWD